MEEQIQQFRAFAAEHRSPRDQEAFETLLAFLQDTVTDSMTYLYWYPLWHVKEGIPKAVYSLEELYHDRAISRLERVLKACGIDRAQAFQLQTTDRGMTLREVSLPEVLRKKDADGDYEFLWDVETYYGDPGRTWLIYVSHEGTVTLAGEALVRAAEKEIEDAYRWSESDRPEAGKQDAAPTERKNRIRMVTRYALGLVLALVLWILALRFF